MKWFFCLFPFVFTLFADATLYNYPGDTEEEEPLFPPSKWGFSMAGPRTSGDVDLFITADFIYWQANEPGLAFAAGASNSLGSGSFKTGGTLCLPDLGWNPGFTVGVGLNLPHDGWDIYGKYTWYHAKSENQINENGSIALLPTPVAPNYTQISNARESLSLRWNDVSVDMYRNTFLSHCLTLAPSIGLAGHWEDQLYEVFYTLTPANSSTICRNRAFQKMTGIGVRGGSEASYIINSCWSIAGNIYGSCLWSRFRNTFASCTIANPINYATPDIGNTYITTYEAWNEIVPVISSLLAVRWERWFDHAMFHLRIQLGWEEKIFFGMNNLLPPYNRQGAPGNLSLAGLNFQLRFGF